jgi:Cache domain
MRGGMAHRIWLGLVPLMLATGVEAQVADVDAFIAAKAAALEVLHRKAERALVAVAQDSSYREYFKARSDHHRQELKERIDRISLEAQSKFDVGEMCLINENGHEISRIVEGEVAHDLSTEEATAIFFEPAFALAPRNVYVSPIYMSPDVHRWVVGYVTPIEVDGEKKAILHYEHDLETYQDLLAKGLSSDDDRFLLAVNEEGWIIADSRREIGIAQRGDSALARDYFERFQAAGSSLEALRDELGGGTSGRGTIILDGMPHSVAWRTIKGWTLLGFGKDHA